jgi:hypothetical protein
MQVFIGLGEGETAVAGVTKRLMANNLLLEVFGFST